MEKIFYEEFPTIGDSLNGLVTPSIETLLNNHETHMLDVQKDAMEGLFLENDTNET